MMPSPSIGAAKEKRPRISTDRTDQKINPTAIQSRARVWY